MKGTKENEKDHCYVAGTDYGTVLFCRLRHQR